jgi:hypothetical protein
VHAVGFVLVVLFVHLDEFAIAISLLDLRVVD